MKTEIFESPEKLSRQAAAFIAKTAQSVLGGQERFTLALSGGRSPASMLQALGGYDLDWPSIHIFQVDERIAPRGSEARNLTMIEASLANAPLPAENIHAMPVENDDYNQGAENYSEVLESLCGQPPILDLVHLGLGSDGHTASLIPNDPVLEVSDRDVAYSEPYQGYRRMTMTYPVLNRATQLFFLVTGADKHQAVSQIQNADPGIPAGRIDKSALDKTVLFADRTALP